MGTAARSTSTDPYHGHRFHVVDTNGFISGGFSTLSLPELIIDTAEYREGLWTYVRRLPLRPHLTGTVTLHRGVSKLNTSFYRWILACAEGKSYRTDIIIKQFHRDDVVGSADYSNAKASREIHCYACVPVRYRPGSDHDSTSADVSIEELDLEPEYMRIFVNGQEVGVDG